MTSDLVDIGRTLARSRDILRALVSGVARDDALLCALDEHGFPTAQRVLSRPHDLPRALVVGRHSRCGLAVTTDARVSLRHVLLTAPAAPAAGAPLHYRGFDLGGRAGVLLADGQRVEGFSFRDRGVFSVGRSTVVALPGGEGGAALLADSDQLLERLTGLRRDPEGALHGTGRTQAEPSIAQLDDGPIGGYRGVDPAARPRPRGLLRLSAVRATFRGRRVQDVAELDVDSAQLRRGLLIGRYSDRCSLAGSGRNLSRVHALVTEETPRSLLVYDLASTNGVRPHGALDGPTHAVVRLTASEPVMLGHFELAWAPQAAASAGVDELPAGR